MSNIFKEGELNKTAADGKTYQVDYFNLDVIISVGYRIKSKQGTQFWIWANQLIKDDLIKGFTINQHRLEQKTQQLEDLQQSVKILGTVLKQKTLETSESEGLLRIISDYAYALDILDQYDYQSIEISNTSGTGTYKLTYEEGVPTLDSCPFIRSYRTDNRT